MGEGDLQHEYQIAMELLEDGEYADALALLNRIAKERPKSKHVMYSRALCLVALGRVGEARALRDQLAGIKGGVARELTAKLDARLQKKMGELEKAAHKGQVRSASSTSGISEPRTLRSILSIVFILLVVLAVVAGAVVFYIQQESTTSNIGVRTLNDSLLPFSGTAPDQYVEVATFYPAGKETRYRLAVFYSPPDEKASAAAADAKVDCIAAPVARDWESLKVKLMKALDMSRSSDEVLKRVPRSNLVCTVVLPRVGTPLSGKLAGKETETFTPGDAKDIAAVLKACGEPDHKETWTHMGACVGLSGETVWWGRIGLGLDAAGEISHVLVRAYPGDKK